MDLRYKLEGFKNKAGFADITSQLLTDGVSSLVVVDPLYLIIWII